MRPALRASASWLLGGLLLCQALLTVSTQVGCGGENLHLLGNDNSAGANDNVTVKGNVQIVTTQHLAVFVFINLTDPGNFTDFAQVKSAAFVGNSSSFELGNLRQGNAALYLVDDLDDDRTIGDSEDFALLADNDRCLRNLQDGDIIEVRGIPADVDEEEVEAQSIIKNGALCSGTVPTPSPSPEETPSPSPTPTPAP